MFGKKKGLNYLSLFILLVLVSVVFLSGCAQQEQQPATQSNTTVQQEQQPTAQSTTPVQQEQEPVVFNVNLSASEQAHKSVINFGKALEERTGGKVKLKLYYNSSLLPIPDQITGLQSGIADISNMTASTFLGALPLNDMLGWPFMGYSNYNDVFALHMKLLQDVPELGAEFSDIGLRVFSGFAMPPHDLLIASNKKVQSPADIKGMKIVSTKPVSSAMIQKWGGAPIAIQIPDYYMSLERGVADGVLLNLHGTLAFGITPLVKQYVSFGTQGLTVENVLYVMSENAWNKMTPETQKIYMEEAAKLNLEDSATVGNNVKKTTEILEKTGALTVLTPEQVAEFSKDAPEIHKEKIAELEKQGKPAQKVYDAIRKAATEMK